MCGVFVKRNAIKRFIEMTSLVRSNTTHRSHTSSLAVAVRIWKSPYALRQPAQRKVAPPEATTNTQQASSATSAVTATTTTIGQPVHLVDRNERGIVRFVGRVHFARGMSGFVKHRSFVQLALVAPGVWVGVELSTPSGKNDGIVAGVRYFTCRALHGCAIVISWGVESINVRLFVHSATTAATATTTSSKFASTTANENAVDNISSSALWYNRGMIIYCFERCMVNSKTLIWPFLRCEDITKFQMMTKRFVAQLFSVCGNRNMSINERAGKILAHVQSSFDINVDDILLHCRSRPQWYEAAIEGIVEGFAINVVRYEDNKSTVGGTICLSSMMIITTESLYTMWQRLGWMPITETFDEYLVRRFVSLCTFERYLIQRYLIQRKVEPRFEFVTMSAATTRSIMHALMRCGIVATSNGMKSVASCCAEPRVDTRLQRARKAIFNHLSESNVANVEELINGIAY
jgi:hypothetical protein